MSTNKKNNNDANTDDKKLKYRYRERSNKLSSLSENKVTSRNVKNRKLNKSDNYTNHNFYNNKKNSTEYFTENHQDEIIISQNDLTTKKGQVSINHLLAFSLPERDEKNHNYKSKPRHNKNSTKNSLHLTNKEFINANHRFIVDHNGHYDIQMADPNIPIDDIFISRVVIRGCNSCPICLEEDSLMIAPRMVSCGHCFCFTCLLAYLDPQRDQNNKTRPNTAIIKPKILRECPLCAELIEAGHILSVFFDENASEMAKYERIKEGEDAVLRLMAKPRNSVFAVPNLTNVNLKEMSSIPWCCGDYMSDQLDDNIFPYARITRGSFKFLLNLFEKEINQIKLDSTSNDTLYSVETNRYAESAIVRIQKEITKLEDSFGFPDFEILNYDQANKLDDVHGLSIENLDLDENEYFYYYQTCFNSNLKYLLSSLDIKILRKTFKEYSQFPSTLVVPIQHISFGEILTEENLNKFKYLSNYPFGTQLAFLEIDWLKSYKNKDNISLPGSVYSLFKKEITERSRINRKRELKEEYNKVKAQRDLERETLKFYERENQQTYQVPSKIHEKTLDLEEQFPSFLEGISNQEPEQTKEFVTTVWGTKVARNDSIYEDDSDGGFDIDATSLMKQLEESKDDTFGGKKKNKKKKFVLISSNNRGL